MLCSSFMWLIGVVSCVFITASILMLFLAGQIALLPELLKLVLFACWYYILALFHWIIPPKRKSIAGLTALVTGAGHGIGRHIALGLAKTGVKLVLLDINPENIDKVAREIEDLNGKAHSYTCDVSKKDDVYRVASKVKLEVGDVDILVNNAGVVTGKMFLSCSDDDIEQTMNVNLMAHFWMLKAFLDGMVKRNHGHIVAIASITALMGAPSLVDYCVSKTGVVMLMEALRQEIMNQKKYGVCFTTILPTKVDTGLFEGAKGRFNSFPPTVQPQFVAMKTIDAIERNETYVILPWWLSPICFLMSFMPQKLVDVSVKFFGIDEGMKEFTGHKKEI